MERVKTIPAQKRSRKEFSLEADMNRNQLLKAEKSAQKSRNTSRVYELGRVMGVIEQKIKNLTEIVESLEIEKDRTFSEIDTLFHILHHHKKRVGSVLELDCMRNLNKEIDQGWALIQEKLNKQEEYEQNILLLNIDWHEVSKERRELKLKL